MSAALTLSSPSFLKDKVGQIESTRRAAGAAEGSGEGVAGGRGIRAAFLAEEDCDLKLRRQDQPNPWHWSGRTVTGCCPHGLRELVSRAHQAGRGSVFWLTSMVCLSVTGDMEWVVVFMESLSLFHGELLVALSRFEVPGTGSTSEAVSGCSSPLTCSKLGMAENQGCPRLGAPSLLILAKSGDPSMDLWVPDPSL